MATAPHSLLVASAMNRLSSLLLVLLAFLVIAAAKDFPHTNPRNHPVLVYYTQEAFTIIFHF